MKTKANHKHTWTLPDGADTNDIIICESCKVNYDEWVEKMMKKGYTYEQLARFQNEN